MRDDEHLEFHTKRINKLLDKAYKHFGRADSYACGGGFGGRSFKARSVQGAVNRGCAALKEAFYNVEQAIKYCRGDEMKLDRLRVSVGQCRDQAGYATFSSFIVADAWDRAVGKWYGELDEQCQNIGESHKERFEDIKSDILAEESQRIEEERELARKKKRRLNQQASVLGLSGKTTRAELDAAYRKSVAKCQPSSIHLSRDQQKATETELAKVNAAYWYIINACN
jgi:hypothetical protein